MDFLYGSDHGTTTHPQCPDTVVDLDQARSGGYTIADGEGNASLTVWIPEEVSGQTLLFQAFEKPSCRVEHTFP